MRCPFSCTVTLTALLRSRTTPPNRPRRHGPASAMPNRRSPSAVFRAQAVEQGEEASVVVCRTAIRRRPRIASVGPGKDTLSASGPGASDDRGGNLMPRPIAGHQIEDAGQHDTIVDVPVSGTWGWGCGSTAATCLHKVLEREAARGRGWSGFGAGVAGLSSRIRFDLMHRDVLAALGASGWDCGRKVDAAPWLAPLAREGYRATALVEEVLSSFGGLTIEQINIDGPNFSNDEPFVFDPLSAGSGQREVAEEIERILGGHYFPIGEWLSCSSVFLESGGRMVASGLGWIWELGGTFETGLELAVRAHRPLVCLFSDPGLDPWPPPIHD
ncbi:SUKH-3 domain-containing protein [Nonomuraea sp. NPDC050691]|uniref:SUKH-3 domain-containing protein n=1 Tax=Nonomuraea sp. NPDC050691 TaxID=3155661 RepID=UPI0033D3B79B